MRLCAGDGEKVWATQGGEFMQEDVIKSAEVYSFGSCGGQLRFSSSLRSMSKLMANRKIDVHAHYVHDFARGALVDSGITNPDGMPGIPDWSVDSHLAYMDVGTQVQLLPPFGIRK